MPAENSQRNPYIVGHPISDPRLFFGREDLFAFAEDNLRQGAKVILLSGQRRIGKSSIIYQLPHFVAPHRFVFVPFACRDKGSFSLGQLLHSLANEIVRCPPLATYRIPLPNVDALEADLSLFSAEFLPAIYQSLGKRNLVFVLDDIDALGDAPNFDDVTLPNRVTLTRFLSYLQTLLNEQSSLFVILVPGQQLNALSALTQIFNSAPQRTIGLLNELQARRLITEPAKDSLAYNPDAIEAVLELSSGHPYFTQAICHALFARARAEQNWYVTRDRVASIVDEAIEISEAGLVWLRDGLSLPERIVFTAVAHAQQRRFSTDPSLPDRALPLTLTQPHKRIAGSSLASVLDDLLISKVKKLFKEILRSITLKIETLLRVDRTTIYLLDEAEHKLWAIWAKGEGDEIPEIEIPVDPDYSVAGYVATHKTPVNSSYSSLKSNAAIAFSEKLHYHPYTMLTLPLLDGAGKLIAVVQLINKLKKKANRNSALQAQIDPKGFVEKDQELFEQFTPLIQVILESSRSFFQLPREFETLIAAIQALNQQTWSLEETLKQATAEARKLMNADRCNLWLIDRQHHELRTKIWQTDNSFTTVSIPLGKGFVGAVATTGKKINIPFDLYDYPDAEIAKTSDRLNGYRTCSLLCMPVFNLDGELIGVTQLVNKKKVGHYPAYNPLDWPEAPECYQASFDPSDLAFMEFFNSQIGSALQNARPVGEEFTGEALVLLKQHGVELIDSLREAEIRLLEWNFLQHLQLVGSSQSLKPSSYKIAVELVRRWLVKKYPLEREIFALEQLVPRANQLYQQATERQHDGKEVTVADLCQKALAENPNHFHALFQGAKAYLDRKDFDRALVLYERAYKVDPSRNLDGFRQVLIERANLYWQQQQFDRAIDCYNQVYKLDPDYGQDLLVRTRLAYGQHLLVQGEFDLAGQQFDRVLNLQPDNQALQAISHLLDSQILEAEKPSEINKLLHHLSTLVDLKDEQKVLIKVKMKTWRRDKEKLKRQERLFQLSEELMLPEALYRQEVERWVRQGTISPVGRKLLEQKRRELGLLPQEAEAIEAEFLEVSEYQRHLQEYQDAWVGALLSENPLSPETWQELKMLQAALNLQDKDVVQIESIHLPMTPTTEDNQQCRSTTPDSAKQQVEA